MQADQRVEPLRPDWRWEQVAPPRDRHNDARSRKVPRPRRQEMPPPPQDQRDEEAVEGQLDVLV